ncbi:MAG: methyl-accepting chemotaxis protein [Chthoniobacteraceae bacterium]
MMILGGTLTAFLLAAGVGFLLTQHIAAPLQGLTEVARQITRGNLNVRVAATERNDEVGALAQAFEKMAQSLREMATAAEQIASGELRTPVKPQSAEDMLGNAFARMVENLREQLRGLAEGATMLGSSASQIVASTTQLAASATEAATAVSETTTTVEEVRQTAQMASQKARTVSENAQRAAQTAAQGRKSVEEAIGGMSRIRQQMEAIASSMARLGEQSQTIGQIIATVEDLAAQSNLLAVNAAIEATKAGEHGKGFGVVAQEVRSLAEQSKEATREVRLILNEIQKATARRCAGDGAGEQGGGEWGAANWRRGRFDPDPQWRSGGSRAGGDADCGFESAAIGGDGSGGGGDGEHQAIQFAECGRRQATGECLL